MRQQGKVVVGMSGLLRRDRLLEAGHHRHKARLWLQPMGQAMHTDTRQRGRALDQRCPRPPQTAQGGVTRAAFAPIQLPLRPQPVERTDAHRNRDVTLGDLFAHHTAWALWVLVEYLPHQGHLHNAKRPPTLKRGT